MRVEGTRAPARTAKAAQVSLRADAAYCASAGALLIGWGDRLALRVGLPVGVLRGSGVATIGWAAAVHRLSADENRRLPIAGVAAVNLLVAGTLAAAGFASTRRDGRRLFGAAALEVAGFACWQLSVLSRGRAVRPRRWLRRPGWDRTR